MEAVLLWAVFKDGFKVFIGLKLGLGLLNPLPGWKFWQDLTL